MKSLGKHEFQFICKVFKFYFPNFQGFVGSMKNVVGTSVSKSKWVNSSIDLKLHEYLFSTKFDQKFHL